VRSAVDTALEIWHSLRTVQHRWCQSAQFGSAGAFDQLVPFEPGDAVGWLPYWLGRSRYSEMAAHTV